jgi:hypothetical protein
MFENDETLKIDKACNFTYKIDLYSMTVQLKERKN